MKDGDRLQLTAPSLNALWTLEDLLRKSGAPLRIVEGPRLVLRGRQRTWIVVLEKTSPPTGFWNGRDAA